MASFEGFSDDSSHLAEGMQIPALQTTVYISLVTPLANLLNYPIQEQTVVGGNAYLSQGKRNDGIMGSL